MEVAFNPVKDAELCSVSSDGVVKFWDARSKMCTNEIRGLGEAFTLAWAPDGESLIVGNKVKPGHLCGAVFSCASFANLDSDGQSVLAFTNPIYAFVKPSTISPDQPNRFLLERQENLLDHRRWARPHSVLSRIGASAT